MRENEELEINFYYDGKIVIQEYIDCRPKTNGVLVPRCEKLPLLQI